MEGVRAKVRGWKWRRIQGRYGEGDQGSLKTETDRGSRKKGIGVKTEKMVKSQKSKGQKSRRGQRSKEKIKRGNSKKVKGSNVEA